MIALDTNVLVRFLVEDDQRQSAQAAALIDRAIAEGTRLLISDIVVCETVWVLTISYRVGRREVVSVLRDLFRARHLVFERPDALSRALAAFEQGRGDFADYLVREQAMLSGCEAVVTFDRALLREPGFRRVPGD